MIATTPTHTRWRRVLPLGLLLAAAALAFAFDLDRYLSLAALREHRAALQAYVADHQLAALLIYTAFYGAVVALSLPVATLLTVAGGFLFGTLIGGAATVISATMGATIVFLAARYAFGDFLKNCAAPWLKRFETGFKRHAASYLLILRLAPVFPFFVVNIAPAFLGVRTSLYVATTFFGIMPGTFVYASVGSGLGAILDAGGAPDLNIVFTPPVLLPLLALSALAALPILLRRLGVLRSADE